MNKILLIVLIFGLWLHMQAIEALSCYRCQIHRCTAPQCDFIVANWTQDVLMCPNAASDLDSPKYHEVCASDYVCGRYELNFTTVPKEATDDPSNTKELLRAESLLVLGCVPDLSADANTCQNEIESLGDIEKNVTVISRTSRCSRCQSDLCNRDSYSLKPQKPPFKPPIPPIKPPKPPKPPSFKPPAPIPYPPPGFKPPHPGLPLPNHPRPPHPVHPPNPPKPPKPDPEPAPEKPPNEIEIELPELPEDVNQSDSDSGSSNRTALNRVLAVALVSLLLSFRF